MPVHAAYPGQPGNPSTTAHRACLVQNRAQAWQQRVCEPLQRLSRQAAEFAARLSQVNQHAAQTLALATDANEHSIGVCLQLGAQLGDVPACNVRIGSGCKLMWV